MAKHRRFADDDSHEEHEHDAHVEAKQALPATTVINAGAVRGVSTYCGMQSARGNVDKDTPINVLVGIGGLPANSIVFAGGVWVSEAFDAGAVLELGNATDPNTYASVPLNVVGFAPLSFKEAGAPKTDNIQLVATVQANDPLTKGRAAFVLAYA